MGMLTKLKELSERQLLVQSAAKTDVTPAMRRAIPKSLLPIVTDVSAELLREWCTKPDWKVVNYIGMIMLRYEPGGIAVYTKLIPFEEGIIELRALAHKLPYNEKVEALLRGRSPVHDQGEFHLPLYVTTPLGGGVMFLSTDGPEL